MGLGPLLLKVSFKSDVSEASADPQRQIGVLREARKSMYDSAADLFK